MNMGLIEPIQNGGMIGIYWKRLECEWTHPRGGICCGARSARTTRSSLNPSLWQIQGDNPCALVGSQTSRFSDMFQDPVFSNIFQYFPVFSNIFQYVPIFSNMFQYFPVCSNILQCFEMFPIATSPIIRLNSGGTSETVSGVPSSRYSLVEISHRCWLLKCQNWMEDLQATKPLIKRPYPRRQWIIPHGRTIQLGES